MIPSISEEAGPLLDYALIKSPAPNILVILVLNSSVHESYAAGELASGQQSPTVEH